MLYVDSPMSRGWRSIALATATACLIGLVSVTSASAGTIPDPAADDASCLGSGSSFYGTFAPRQRAFVAAAVISQAAGSDGVAGDIYQVFAQEKEGGSIPAPCGTRLE